jgi:hypothetical protein
MTKKTPISNVADSQPSGAEASVLRALANGETTVAGVVGRVASEGHHTDEAVGALLALERDKKVTVQESKPYTTLASYAWSPLSVWFWAAVGAVAVSLAVITVTSGVALYLRYVFGSALVLFLPGYSLIEALYPKRELDELTRFALSIGLSLALVPLTGLVLNHTPFGIRLLPVAISLAGLTVVLLGVAVKRRYDYYKLSKGIL